MAGAVGGSIVSQGFGVATGLQDKFSWKGVALAGISGGVGGGLGSIGGSGALAAAGRGALGNAITQGVAVATGLQSKFDFTGVAVGAAAGAGVGATGKWGGFGGRLASGGAGALAGAAARSLADGSDFGDNILAALPDVIGSTIGESVARGRAGSGRRAVVSDSGAIQQARVRQWATEDQYPGYRFIDSPAQDGSYPPDTFTDDIVVTGYRTARSWLGGFFKAADGFLNSLVHGAARSIGQATDYVNRVTMSIERAGPRSSNSTYRALAVALTANRQAWNYTANGIRSINDRYHVTTRAAGVVQTLGGVVEVISGGGLAAAGIAGEGPTFGLSTIAVVGGGATATFGVDNVQAGVRTVWSGRSVGTGGGALASHVLGVSAAKGELIYGGLQVVTGVGSGVAASRLAASAPAVLAAETTAVDVAGGSARLRYMGATPDKFSRTGGEVLERMRGDGLIVGDGPLLRGNPNDLRLVTNDGLVRIDSTIDMAHQADAVTWWNQTGRFYGAKSPEVRQFMLDSDNYILQPRSINRSEGARLGQTYQPPAPTFTTLKR